MTNFESKHVDLLKNKKYYADVYSVTLIKFPKNTPMSNFMKFRPVGSESLYANGQMDTRRS